MTEHAILGASGSKRWMTCAGSIRMEEPFPDTTSRYAEEGTAAHALAEACLQGDLDYMTLEDSLGTILTGTNAPITMEMIHAVREYVSYVHSVVTDIEAAGDKVEEQMVEARVSLEDLNPPSPMFGTADLILWTRNRHLHVIDYKHGQGVPVDVVENPQVLYYALGAVLMLRKMPASITCHVCQPRGHHPDGPMRSWKFGYERLVEFKQELLQAAEATQAEDAPLVPGDHCRFCKAHAVCPAQADLANSVAIDLFAEADEPNLVPDVTRLTPEQLSRALEVKDLIFNWLRAVESHAIDELLTDPESVPGFKLVEGRQGNRRWIDEDQALAYLWKTKRIPKKDLFPPKLGSPAHVERVLKDRGLGDDFLDELTTRSDGKPKLVPADDPREALLLDATQHFETETDS